MGLCSSFDIQRDWHPTSPSINETLKCKDQQLMRYNDILRGKTYSMNQQLRRIIFVDI